MKVTALFLILILSASLLLAKERIDLEFTTPDQNHLKIDLPGVGGKIAIQGWGRNHVSIKGESWGERDRCDLDIWERRSGINISHDCRSERDRRRLNVELIIRVPDNFDIQITAATQTEISNVRGKFEMSIANASVELNALRGEIELSTANGRVTITNSDLEGDISNVNGKLKIRASNISGKVSTVNARQEVSDAPAGIRVKSVNGGIDIGSAKEFVSANTVNGNVEIGELDGDIEAKTVNGNVAFEMVGGHDIDIETMNGNVDLQLPNDFSMDVDIKIRNDGGRQDFYQIVSDFDIEIEEEVRRYDAVASGSVRGGRNKVRIHTVNGNVYLRKAGNR